MESALKKFLFILVVLFSAEQLFAYNTKVFFNNDNTKSYVDPYREILKPGSDFEQVMIKEINSAKKSVYLAVQEFNLTFLAKALVAAKKRGIDVKVMLEDTYNRSFARIPKAKFKKLSPHLKAKVFEQLKFLDNKPNAKSIDEIKISNKEIIERDALLILKKGEVPVKDDSRGKQKTSSLMHHKFVVIDQKVTIVSSANFTRSGTHGDFDKPHSIGNANAMVVLKSYSISKHFTEEFRLMWKGIFKKHKPYRGVKSFRHEGGGVRVQFSPTRVSKLGWEKSTNATISKVVKRAKREFVANLFNFTSQPISDALGETKYKNPRMDVELLIDPTFATRYYSGLLDMWGLELRNSQNCKLQDDNKIWKKRVKTGGKPILTHGDKLHHKFAVIDREIVIFGSHNWSDSGNYTNDESLLIIKNRWLAKQFIREHNRLFRMANLGPSKSLLQKIADINRKCKVRGRNRRRH